MKKNPNKVSIIIAYFVMIIIALSTTYFLEHTLLHLPIKIIFISGSLSIIAVTIGTFIAFFAKAKK